MTATNFKSITIIEEDYSGKTRKFTIIWNATGDIVGEINWCGSWQKYCLYTTNSKALFDSNSLHDICTFMDKLMEERKK